MKIHRTTKTETTYTITLDEKSAQSLHALVGEIRVNDIRRIYEDKPLTDKDVDKMYAVTYDLFYILHDVLSEDMDESEHTTKEDE